MNLGSLRPAIGFFTTSLDATQSSHRSWTFPTILGVFLHTLEEEYGRRDTDYTFLGIEFFDGGPLILYQSRKQLTIALSADAAHEPSRALWQLAHEAVHLLAPTGDQNIPVVEEGLATIFANRAFAEWGYGWKDSASPPYIAAAEVTARWIELFPKAIASVRAIEPCFARWTAATIQMGCPGTPDELAKSLCARF